MIAADRTRIAELMYERWVRGNAEAVTTASSGKVGYIHIPSMDDAGLEVFVRSLYSDHFDKDAIVIDVRYNGGGFTHDQVLNYLAGKEHTFFRQRDGGEGLVLRNDQRKWTKPLVVLTNNRSYSDAEIFPHAFRALGLGKVVGQATGGFVIGTGSTRLIDGSTFRLPRTGVFTNAGVNMEKQGVTPDVAVECDPGGLAEGDRHPAPQGCGRGRGRRPRVEGPQKSAIAGGQSTSAPTASVSPMPVAPMPKVLAAPPSPIVPPGGTDPAGELSRHWLAATPRARPNAPLLRSNLADFAFLSVCLGPGEIVLPARLVDRRTYSTREDDVEHLG